MVAARHAHLDGTTGKLLAWIKVAASHHAQHNPHALLRDVVTVEQVMASPMVCDPLRRLDCCVVTDGGGALVVTRPEIARSLKRPLVAVRGAGEAPEHLAGGYFDITRSAAIRSGRIAFEEAGVTPADIKYVSLYDSFTITVLMQIEDLGFCAKGEGGKFVADGNLISGVGKLPFNTDGGAPRYAPASPSPAGAAASRTVPAASASACLAASACRHVARRRWRNSVRRPPPASPNAARR